MTILMACTTRKQRMERWHVAQQKVSSGMCINEVVDFVASEWGAPVQARTGLQCGFEEL